MRPVASLPQSFPKTFFRKASIFFSDGFPKQSSFKRNKREQRDRLCRIGTWLHRGSGYSLPIFLHKVQKNHFSHSCVVAIRRFASGCLISLDQIHALGAGCRGFMDRNQIFPFMVVRFIQSFLRIMLRPALSGQVAWMMRYTDYSEHAVDGSELLSEPFQNFSGNRF